MNQSVKSNMARAYFHRARKAFLVAILVCPLWISGCSDKGQSLEDLLAQEQALCQEKLSSECQEGMFSGGGYGNGSQSSNSVGKQGMQDESVQETGEQIETLWVHICGYVQTPGIYELPVDSRIYDGLMAAGGFVEGADETALNLADYLQDGSQVYVPGLAAESSEDSGSVRAETIVGSTSGKANSHADATEQLVNINTASQKQLESLPGIGESRARDIIAYRESNGPFESIEDIQKISGIKTAIYTKMKDLITVGK